MIKYCVVSHHIRDISSDVQWAQFAALVQMPSSPGVKRVPVLPRQVFRLRPAQVFDPVFTDADRMALAELGLQVPAAQLRAG